MPERSSKGEYAELRRFAHDLRNALSALYSYAQLLEMSLQKPGLEEELKIAEAIGESVRKMDALISERVDALQKPHAA